MRSARTTAVLAAVVLAALAAAAAAVLGDCGGGHAAPLALPADAHLAQAPAAPVSAASAAVAPAASVDGSAPPPGARATAADRLEAVRTVALYCRLVDEGQFARAGELCSARRLWSRRVWSGVRRFRFRSARVYAAPDARTLVLKARVRVHAGPGRPQPGGPAVVFFTLGRVGNAVGGWLITAVSTSP